MSEVNQLAKHMILSLLLVKHDLTVRYKLL